MPQNLPSFYQSEITEYNGSAMGNTLFLLCINNVEHNKNMCLFANFKYVKQSKHVTELAHTQMYTKRDFHNYTVDWRNT